MSGLHRERRLFVAAQEHAHLLEGGLFHLHHHAHSFAVRLWVAKGALETQDRGSVFLVPLDLAGEREPLGKRAGGDGEEPTFRFDCRTSLVPKKCGDHL
jgi:hypothetical protein